MTGKSYTLRCQLPEGQCTIDHLSDLDTLADLKAALFSLTDITPDRLIIMVGLPPTKINDNSDETLLASIFSHQRERLIVTESKDSSGKARFMRFNVCLLFLNNTFLVTAGSERRSRSPINQNAAESNSNARPLSPKPRPLPVKVTFNSNTGFLLRKVVPANNSCLFTAVHFCLTDGQFDPTIGKTMRKIIAETVRSDELFYNEAFLGKKNSDYISWILNDEHWGGAIELFILSQHHSIEIVAVDTQNERLNRFGEDKNYAKRIFLIYDGIHYDALYFEFFNSKDSATSQNVTTKFPCSATSVLDMALQLAREAKANRQFTDVQNFTLRCLVCSEGLKGQSQAQEHAKKTGHTNFGEV
jgi:ubiquitin thioesterase OTU1